MQYRAYLAPVLIWISGACGGEGSLPALVASDVEAEAKHLETVAGIAERGASPLLSVQLRHIAQVVRLSRRLSPVTVSVDGVATPFLAVTELFFVELPVFPAESLATGAHLHLWQRPDADRLLTLFSPSVGGYPVISRFSLQPSVGATGELLSRAGEEWLTSSGSLAGKLIAVFDRCVVPEPSRDHPGFGCRHALFRQSLDATVTSSVLDPVNSSPFHRLVLTTSDVEGVLLPALPVLPMRLRN